MSVIKRQLEADKTLSGESKAAIADLSRSKVNFNEIHNASHEVRL